MAAKKNHLFDLSTCARANIIALQPYRCARDDYQDDGTNILLDANENAYGPSLPLDSHGRLPSTHSTPSIAEIPNGVNGTKASSPQIDLQGLNRYPDPHQGELKSLLCALRNPPASATSAPPLTPANLFLGVGSDEAIDALLRCFCPPSQSSILTCPPTYGMYAVSAAVNDVSILTVPLSLPNFDLQSTLISTTLDANPSIKLLYITSPGNPTGRLIDPSALRTLLAKPWNGIIVVDEAYIDFAHATASVAPWVTSYDNLVVLQTLSKAFGLAGIRLGAAFASPPIARLLNNLKAPYNISSPTSSLAIRALRQDSISVMNSHRARILTQRERLLTNLRSIPGVGPLIGGLDSNFLLVVIRDRPEMGFDSGNLQGRPSNEVALKVYARLAEEKGVVVRFRGKEYGCEGALRITVGTEEEVTRFLTELKRVLEDVYVELRPAGLAEKRVTGRDVDASAPETRSGDLPKKQEDTSRIVA